MKVLPSRQLTCGALTQSTFAQVSGNSHCAQSLIGGLSVPAISACGWWPPASSRSLLGMVLR
jgi:hypothetical protein